MQNTNDKFRLHNTFSLPFFGLIFSWLFGAFLAFCVCCYSESFLFSMVRRAFGCSLSIVDRIAVSSLPVIMAVMAASFDKAELFPFLFFFKSFQYSFCTIAVYNAFGDSGWLAQLLIMFSDSFITVCLIAFCMQCIIHKGFLSHKSMVVFVVFCAIVILLDVFYIAPMAVLLGI